MINSTKDLIKYWDERSAKQGDMTVGFAGYDRKTFEQKTKEWTIRFAPFWRQHLSGTIMDYGCGIGRFTGNLGENVIGIDITENLLTIAKKVNPGLTFKLSNPERIPLPDSHIDSIWCCTVMQHIVVPGLLEDTIKEFNRVLKPKGKMLFYENTFRSMRAGHVWFRNENEYRKLFEDEGFEIKVLMNIQEASNEKHTLFLGEKK